MAAAFLILLREGFEAALVIGIILAVLDQMGQSGYMRSVVGGVLAAIAAGIAFAFAADAVSGLFEGSGEEVLSGIILAAAAAMLTYVMVWMRESRKGIKAKLASDVQERLGGHRLSIFVLAFLSVFREGAESVLFLWGVLIGGRENVASVVTGGLLGVLSAVLIAWLLFQGGRRIPIAFFFNITTWMLVFIAAGMLSSAAGYWVAIDWLPALINPVWDTSSVLSETSGIGRLLGIMMGYNANPSLTEVLVYVTYLAAIGVWIVLGARFRQDPSAGEKPISRG